MINHFVVFEGGCDEYLSLFNVIFRAILKPDIEGYITNLLYLDLHFCLCRIEKAVLAFFAILIVQWQIPEFLQKAYYNKLAIKIL